MEDERLYFIGREKNAMEKAFLAFTKDNNYDHVKCLLTVDNVFVDVLDDDGMTALGHAAYKGYYKLCKLFLDCGADVNLSEHVSRYSALTFASLSGNADVVRLLLEHGANPTSLNSINKTAAQMAAFVGNHLIVSIINNFIPISEIHYFTKVQGLESEPKLPLEMAGIVHKIAITTNINPVRLALYVKANLSLIENAKKVALVFEMLSKKKFHDEGNELLSLKFHHLSQVLLACEKFVNDQKSKSTTSAEHPHKECLNPLIKHWLRSDIMPDAFKVNLEKFLRQIVLEYPYVENSLFQRLVSTLAPTALGDEPSAISIILEAFNGLPGSMVDSLIVCATCGDPNVEKKCSACKSVLYCDKTCQKLHWFAHKNYCSQHRSDIIDGVKNLDLNSDPEGKHPSEFSDEPGCSYNA